MALYMCSACAAFSVEEVTDISLGQRRVRYVCRRCGKEFGEGVRLMSEGRVNKFPSAADAPYGGIADKFKDKRS